MVLDGVSVHSLHLDEIMRIGSRSLHLLVAKGLCIFLRCLEVFLFLTLHLLQAAGAKDGQGQRHVEDATLQLLAGTAATPSIPNIRKTSTNDHKSLQIHTIHPSRSRQLRVSRVSHSASQAGAGLPASREAVGLANMSAARAPCFARPPGTTSQAASKATARHQRSNSARAERLLGT